MDLPSIECETNVLNAMKLGSFDQKIQFVSEGKVSDGKGGYIPQEIVELSTYAAIEQLKQSRSLEQVQMKLPSAYRVSIHARESFTPTVGKKVKWRGEYFNIITAPVEENTRYRKLLTFDICQQ